MKTGFTDEAGGDLTQPPVLTSSKIRSLQGNVPRHIGWIEPWIGGSVVCATALTALIGHGQAPMLWVYTALAALLAWWSWRRPARRQTELLLRAAILMVLGFLTLIQIETHQDRAANVNWVVVPLILYAILLKPRLVWSLLGFCLGLYLLIIYWFHPVATPEFLFLRAGFVFIFSAAATHMGEVMRRTDELLEERRVDTSSGLLNEYGFMDHGKELWRHCRQARIPATLVFLDVPDLLKIREVYHAGATGMVEAIVLQAVDALDVGKHVLARLSMWRFALLMPGTTHEQALKFVGDRLGHPPVIKIDEGPLDLVFLVDVRAVESRRQDMAFADFYKTELAVLDAQVERARAVGSNPVASEKFIPDRSAGKASGQGAAPLPVTIPMDF
ncbi:GGDEF domain-containing protein [Rhodoferax sediminis]|uniref:GGDEF domain-containing protein n=1 Tax=Rhodoferax sediminis TaxID=2509614 RepID=A0A515D8K6_9BURK|nr:GGDEF domain-containing protein [Rhodoferax sediminis]QDL36739.1 GGDEF domain-containing protein [Rhodoferax sediminis]